MKLTLGGLRNGVLAAVSVAFFAIPHGGVAQTIADGQVQADSSGALVAPDRVLVPADAQVGPVNGAETPGEAQATLDYDAWNALANTAEATIANGATTALAFEQLRPTLVEWRAAFQKAQTENSARIATLRTQITALGPIPAEGVAEVAEIAARRAELNDQLARLEAPGLAADEAYQRSVGLINEIDQLLLSRQTDELMQLWPMPINPANWPAAYRALSVTAASLYSEFSVRWANEDARANLSNKLPLVLGLLILAAFILWRGIPWIDRLTFRLQNGGSERGRRIWTFIASLGQIFVPFSAVMLITVALRQTGMLGVLSYSLVQAFPAMGITFLGSRWLGHRVFPVGASVDAPLRLARERRAEGRLLAVSFGLLYNVELLRQLMMDRLDSTEAVTSVLSFPIIVVCGVLLFRLGSFLQRHASAATQGDATTGYFLKLAVMLARGAMAIGIIGPLLAAVGYVSAASAMVYPAVMSLGLIGLLTVVQRLVADVYIIVARRDVAEAGDALVPVLINFALTLASVPVFALIWGTRMSSILELWNQFRDGFVVGDARISPTMFLLFAVVFGIGYAVTRLFQGALRSSILPRTSLDQGGQNAVVSGIGYVGIALASLIGINAAGLDLSGLAIVAGALSVGVGFGLQAVVSNFVSGIILLIERPVSEGDWIEVGTTQGIVQSISVRSTRIQTFDRSDVIVPNSDLISGKVTNFTRFNLTGRLIVPIGVAYGTDTRRVEKILTEIAEAQPMVVLNPPPAIVLIGFGADSVNFEMRMILRDVNFNISVRSDVNHAIAQRFREEGIEIPFAQRDIHLRNVGALADAFRKPIAAPNLSDGGAAPETLPEPSK